MEIQGKVKALLPEQSGTSSRTGNTWKSQEFVLDYFWWPNQVFASQMVLKMFGEERIAKWNLRLGDEVKVKYHVEAHYWDNRWFNEIRCDGIEKIGASAVVVAAQPQPTANEVTQKQPIEVSYIPDIYSNKPNEAPKAPAPQPQQQKEDDLPF